MYREYQACMPVKAYPLMEVISARAPRPRLPLYPLFWISGWSENPRNKSFRTPSYSAHPPASSPSNELKCRAPTSSCPGQVNGIYPVVLSGCSILFVKFAGQSGTRLPYTRPTVRTLISGFGFTRCTWCNNTFNNLTRAVPPEQSNHGAMCPGPPNPRPFFNNKVRYYWKKPPLCVAVTAVRSRHRLAVPLPSGCMSVKVQSSPGVTLHQQHPPSGGASPNPVNRVNRACDRIACTNQHPMSRAPSIVPSMHVSRVPSMGHQVQHMARGV